MDKQLERLVGVLDGANGGRNLWIITADHGEALGDHGYVGHGKHLYEAQLHVPLIFYGGEEWSAAGGTVEQMVRHVDLPPTVLELMGVPSSPDTDFEGRSLAGLLSDPEAPPRREYAFAQRRPPNPARLRNGWVPGLVIAARSERYKYILYSDAADEFYDLDADPGETRNLAGEEIPAKEDLVRWLAQKYEAMLADPLAAGSEEIEAEYLEELEALGYL